MIPLLRRLEDVVAGPVYTPRGDIAQPIVAFDNPSSSTLRALRGEFFLTPGLASQPASGGGPVRTEIRSRLGVLVGYGGGRVGLRLDADSKPTADDHSNHFVNQLFRGAVLTDINVYL